MVALCVLGLFSYARLGVEQMPDVSPPIVFTEVKYPGASPAAVETEITKPLEDAFNGIAGVKMIRSNSWEGLSQTVVEFKVDTDMRCFQQIVQLHLPVPWSRSMSASKVTALQWQLPW